jgi:hypothetical protein
LLRSTPILINSFMDGFSSSGSPTDPRWRFDAER